MGELTKKSCPKIVLYFVNFKFNPESFLTIIFSYQRGDFLKYNLLSYIKEYYGDSIKAKVDRLLDRNRSKLFKIEKVNHSHSIVCEVIL